jgi:hypothetical protein
MNEILNLPAVKAVAAKAESPVHKESSTQEGSSEVLSGINGTRAVTTQ